MHRTVGRVSESRTVGSTASSAGTWYSTHLTSREVCRQPKTRAESAERTRVQRGPRGFHRLCRSASPNRGTADRRDIAHHSRTFRALVTLATLLRQDPDIPLSSAGRINPLRLPALTRPSSRSCIACNFDIYHVQLYPRSLPPFPEGAPMSWTR